MHQPVEDTPTDERRWHVGDTAFFVDFPYCRRCGLVEIIDTVSGMDGTEQTAAYAVRSLTPILDHGSDNGRGSFHDSDARSAKSREEGDVFTVNYYQLERPLFGGK